MKLDEILNQEFKALKFLKLNSQEYRAGLMILVDGKPFEIVYLFQIEQSFKLFCHPYLNLGFDESMNSIEILKETSLECISYFDVFELKNMKSYEKMLSRGKFYIIADTLEVYRNF